MLFKFLRQYLWDDEFEQNKSQLEESQRLLSEYKTFIEKEKDKATIDKEKVDPDFLVMVWASLGIALSLGAYATGNLPKSDEITPFSILSFNIIEIVWLVIALLVVVFIILNGLFALELTLDYAKSKSQQGYKYYAWSLISLIIVIFIGLVINAQIISN